MKLDKSWEIVENEKEGENRRFGKTSFDLTKNMGNQND